MKKTIKRLGAMLAMAVLLLLGLNAAERQLSAQNSDHLQQLVDLGEKLREKLPAEGRYLLSPGGLQQFEVIQQLLDGMSAGRGGLASPPQDLPLSPTLGNSPRLASDPLVSLRTSSPA